ncbi:class I tRNA ligase family protein [Nocardia sp. NBC_00508]|uniref:class I tRNA ligase family protein n=1 Tax=Nocardia sp. NBC_00508 TaxID=2975992 RepID=UPI002E806551|nr:class I tRNA ligase family protein [Nocardia sp. NBC_00508]WUD66299.1 class I tRNA ligase family protein [Nocardia sp. NBC_00508]
MTGPVIVISPAPTANGDLHLGHIAGPFLAADVYTRYARATGREVLFGTGVQDTSSYVVTTAHRIGATPQALVERSAKEVEATLTALGIAVDAFTGWEERFTSFVARVVAELRAKGALRLRPMPFPYVSNTGEYLVDGHVAGNCPVCLADSCAGLCESCGHPVTPGELLDPRSTRDPAQRLEIRDVEVLVLPLERYRDRLRAHFTDGAAALRPHAAQVIDELLAGPLLDFPVTYPVSWGIPAPGLPGQVVNPNAEPLAWTMYCSMLAAEKRGLETEAEDALWRLEAAAQVVYFLGIDNIYPFGISGLAMLLAYGEYALPKLFLTNEFYELRHEKFSTSRGHLVWGRDLAETVPRDLIRFHLAAGSPELQRTSFDHDEFVALTRTRLVEPWNRVAAEVDAWVWRGPLPVSDRGRADAVRIVERFRGAYELPRFSLHRAAEALTQQLARLDRATIGSGGDFCHQVDVLLRCAAPILIDLAAEGLRGADMLPHSDLRTVAQRTTIEPVRLPRLQPVRT